MYSFSSRSFMMWINESANFFSISGFSSNISNVLLCFKASLWAISLISSPLLYSKNSVLFPILMLSSTTFFMSDFLMLCFLCKRLIFCVFALIYFLSLSYQLWKITIRAFAILSILFWIDFCSPTVILLIVILLYRNAEPSSCYIIIKNLHNCW